MAETLATVRQSIVDLKILGLLILRLVTCVCTIKRALRLFCGRMYVITIYKKCDLLIRKLTPLYACIINYSYFYNDSRITVPAWTGSKISDDNQILTVFYVYVYMYDYIDK